MKKEYKPLNMFIEQTDELKKLIAEHPDYPIVVICDSDVVEDDSYYLWYAPSLTFSIGEILDCDQDINDEMIYDDRGEFWNDIEYLLFGQEEYANLSDEEFKEAVQAEYDKYEPYWKNVIVIHADV